MSTTPTTNLNLIKNNADEPIANWRTNDNANMNALDTAIKAVQDATDTLEKARQNLNNLIGVLGKNSSNADLISKAQARANLDVAQSGGAAKTLYADEQTIAQNASLIASLQDSVAYEYVSNISDIASGGPNVIVTGAVYVHFGKLAQVAVQCKATSNLADLDLACTIVSGKRPSMGASATEGFVHPAEFYPSGAMIIRRAITSGTVFTLRSMYILA